MKPAVKKYEGTINFEDFELIECPQSNVSVMAINISESGYITLNKYFLDEIKTYDVRFSASKDRRTLLIDTNNEPNYKFNKSGSKHDPDFCKSLCRHNIQLPAKYIMHYSEQECIWVGVLVNSNKKSKFEKALKNSIKSDKTGG